MIRNFVTGLALLCLMVLSVSCKTGGEQRPPNLTALTEPTPIPERPGLGSTNEDLLFWALDLEGRLGSANNDKLLIRRAIATLPECNWFLVLRNKPCDSDNDGLAD